MITNRMRRMLFHFCLKLRYATHFKLADNSRPITVSVANKIMNGVSNSVYPKKLKNMLASNEYCNTCQNRSKRFDFWYKINRLKTTRVEIKKAPIAPIFRWYRKLIVIIFSVNLWLLNANKKNRIDSASTVAISPVANTLQSKSIKSPSSSSRRSLSRIGEVGWMILGNMVCRCLFFRYQSGLNAISVINVNSVDCISWVFC